MLNLKARLEDLAASVEKYMGEPHSCRCAGLELRTVEDGFSRAILQSIAQSPKPHRDDDPLLFGTEGECVGMTEAEVAKFGSLNLDSHVEKWGDEAVGEEGHADRAFTIQPEFARRTQDSFITCTQMVPPDDSEKMVVTKLEPSIFDSHTAPQNMMAAVSPVCNEKSESTNEGVSLRDSRKGCAVRPTTAASDHGSDSGVSEEDRIAFPIDDQSRATSLCSATDTEDGRSIFLGRQIRTVEESRLVIGSLDDLQRVALESDSLLAPLRTISRTYSGSDNQRMRMKCDVKSGTIVYLEAGFVTQPLPIGMDCIQRASENLRALIDDCNHLYNVGDKLPGLENARSRCGTHYKNLDWIESQMILCFPNLTDQRSADASNVSSSSDRVAFGIFSVPAHMIGCRTAKEPPIRKAEGNVSMHFFHNYLALVATKDLKEEDNVICINVPHTKFDLAPPQRKTSATYASPDDDDPAKNLSTIEQCSAKASIDAKAVMEPLVKPPMDPAHRRRMVGAAVRSFIGQLGTDENARHNPPPELDEYLRILQVEGVGSLDRKRLSDLEKAYTGKVDPASTAILERIRRAQHK